MKKPVLFLKTHISGYVKKDGTVVQAHEDKRDKAKDSYIPPHLEIDGVLRSATNSRGKPIHQTEEWIRNFWRWFGDSKAVDDQGRPMVVFHGSKTKGITSFDIDLAGENANEAIWFTDDSRQAGSYADPSNRGKGEIYEVYLKAENPLTVDAMDAAREEVGDVSDWETASEVLQYADWSSGLVDDARTSGHDSLIITSTGDAGTYSSYLATHFAVFSPSQIKSATENSGAYSRDHDDMSKSICLFLKAQQRGARERMSDLFPDEVPVKAHSPA